MLKRVGLILLSIFICGSTLQAQVDLVSRQLNSFTSKTEKKFSNYDIAVGVGTMGLSMEGIYSFSPMLSVRAGIHYMPQFKVKLSFGVKLENDTKNPDNPKEQTKFDRIAEKFEQITGFHVDDRIEMIGEPTLLNGSLILDVAPFKNKNFYFSAGAFWGSRGIAKAYNTTEDMPTLFSVAMYNRMYESVDNDEPLFIYHGNCIYVDPELGDQMIKYGRMQINIGKRKNGEPYYVEPNEESMVKVRMKVNAFKPYLAFGYKGGFKNLPQYHFAIEGGLLFWGGAPHVVVHDGVDLSRDLTYVKGKPGRYVRFFNKFEACTMLSIRMIRTF